MRRFPRRRRQFERLQIIRADREDFERRHFLAECFGGFRQALFGNVDWQISDEILQMAEQHPRLDPRARAKADEFGIVADRFRDLGTVMAQDLRLGPGHVILGQLADLLEEIRAAFVIEKLARQGAGRAGKSRDGLFEKI